MVLKHHWMKRRSVQALAGVVGFGVTYLLFSWALDSGNLLVYLLMAAAFIASLRQLGLAVWPRRTERV